MSRLAYLKTIGPGELTAGRLAEAAWRRAAEIPHRAAWELGGREARARLEEFRDRHRGERCFVVANGPSLRDMDLSPLKGERTLGMNRIYRLAESTGWLPTYLVVIDIDVQIQQISDELRALSIPRFINWNGRRHVPPDPLTHYLKLTFRPRFSTDATRGMWGGHSVTYCCIQLAYFMGFTEVVLIGKDHSYRETGVPGQVVRATGAESNHAVPGYYAPGAAWRIPDYKGEELAYTMAREAFERAGRRIVDATVGGKLQVFDKVDYQSLF